MNRTLVVLWLIFGATFLSAPLIAADQPNIVFVLADDLGLGDVSHHVRHIQKRKPVVETPTLDGLVKLGLWFSDGHSATALCAPTRYATMSGNNNYRSYAPAGVWSTFGKSAFKQGEATLGTVVRDAGYQTGFVGKWHLGGDFEIPNSESIYRGKKNGDLTGKVDLRKFVSGGPRDCGFEYDFTTPCGIQGPVYMLYENQAWWPLKDDSKITFLNPKNAKNPADLASKGPGMGDSNWNTRDMGKLLSAKAVEFINHSSKQNEPFFLYYCSPMVHRPHIPPVEFDGKKIKGSTPSSHLDMVLDFDMQIKRIVDALKSNGEFENTLLVITSDNGALRDSVAARKGYQPGGGWSGSKNSPLEGGHRVPFFAVWPQRIKPGETDVIATTQDMVATFAAIVGTEIPKGQARDSNNLLPILTGEGTFTPREYFIQQAGSNHELMFRTEQWKLIIQSNPRRSKFDPLALFNLETDPAEQENLMDQASAQVRVQKLLKHYREIIDSERPTVVSRR